MFFNIDVYGDYVYNFRDDEREGFKIKGLVVGVVFFRVFLFRVFSIDFCCCGLCVFWRMGIGRL